MNCVTHNEVAAVATCQNCSVGLCKECIDKGLKNDNKPLCKNCSLAQLEQILKELEAASRNIDIRKIVWTIIFIVGGISILYGLYITERDNVFYVIIGLLIWALAGITDLFKMLGGAQSSQDTETAVRNAIRKEKGQDDIIGHSIGYFIIALGRGLFFPIFYFKLMFFSGKKEIQNQILETQKLKEELESY